jgi:hypothetical protein
MDPFDLAHSRGKSEAVLAALALVAGAASMAISFVFLASGHHLDVVAGAAGFVAGSVLIAGGLLALAVVTRSRPGWQTAALAARCMLIFGPPTVAAASWPVLYFGLFLAGFFLIPVVLLACAVWAWPVSASVATDFSALMGWRDRHSGRPYAPRLRALLFAFELVAIAASLPLFRALLDLLESLGHKVGWS